VSHYYGEEGNAKIDSYLMNVTLLRWTVETALSSHVASSGQYKTYVCSSAVDVNARIIYNPDLRMGSATLAM
jgi:hypothetical protein